MMKDVKRPGDRQGPNCTANSNAQNSGQVSEATETDRYMAPPVGPFVPTTQAAKRQKELEAAARGEKAAM